MDINRLKQLAGTQQQVQENVRQVTNQMVELMDEGILDPHTLAMACLSYMSEDDVRDMAEMNGFIIDDEDEDEDM